MKGFNKDSFQGILQQAQAAQGKLRELQEELGNKTVEAAAGGGMVTVVVNGRQEIVSVKIEEEVIKSGDRDMLQDLVAAAVNQGIKKSQELVAAELSKVTGGLPFPGPL